MARNRKVGTLMHNLLIDRELDGFTVVEIRDAFVEVDPSIVDLDEARRRVYRQILRFIRHGWLHSEGSGREKRYYQTGLFKQFLHELNISESNPVTIQTKRDYSVLIREKKQYKGELNIVLTEIDGYQSLFARFPELEPKLASFHVKAIERSAFLLGQINVLTNALNVVPSDASVC